VSSKTKYHAAEQKYKEYFGTKKQFYPFMGKSGFYFQGIESC
jgi:hypothetical protein